MLLSGCSPTPHLRARLRSPCVHATLQFFCLYFTYPAYAIGNKIRKAVRTHQYNKNALGAFVDEFFSHAAVVYGIPMLYLTMGSVVVLLQLASWPLGSKPGEGIDDDDDDAEAAVEEYEAATSVVWADGVMNLLLFAFFSCQLALFATGLSDVRALMAFRVPLYQRVIGTALVICSLVALWLQAAKAEGVSGDWGPFNLAFGLSIVALLLALGCGLPLNDVLVGDQGQASIELASLRGAHGGGVISGVTPAEEGASTSTQHNPMARQMQGGGS